MSVPLAEALQQVELELGRVYSCRVKGRRIELRVLDDPEEKASYPAIRVEDGMLDIVIDLPYPEPAGTVIAQRGELDPPDIPVIPAEEPL